MPVGVKVTVIMIVIDVVIVTVEASLATTDLFSVKEVPPSPEGNCQEVCAQEYDGRLGPPQGCIMALSRTLEA